MMTDKNLGVRFAQGAWLLLLITAVAAPVVADTIESRTGVRISGKVIAQDDGYITMEVRVGSRTIPRRYPVKLIHTVTINGQTQTLNPRAGQAPTPTPRTSPTPSRSAAPTPKPSPSPIPSGNGAAASARKARSRAEVEAYIKQVGEAEPDWWDATPLEYPDTLDLSWPQPPPTKGWNNKKNVGQYLWDRINPNEGRWRSGIRLVHFLRDRHRTDRSKRERITNALAGMYFRLLRDWARAAYWWKQAGVKPGDQNAVALAECYWRLGAKPVAVEYLNQRTLRPEMIKLWGDMGETEKALEVAEVFYRQNVARLQVTLLAGDACRTAGRYDEAMTYYRQTLDLPLPNPKRDQRFHDRARANLEAMRLFDRADPARVADGAYRASSLGYQGQVEVEVVVAGGRIKGVRVVNHREKQFYSALNDMPAQIIAKQGLKGLDATSRATITAEAIINATAKAMAKGAQ
ncbi:MAG: FMN-binding protein [Planctomycetota bacterium]|jgi:uncharacterized protein with FMN-binding domain